MVTINGKEFALKLDFGATRLMKKDFGINFYAMDENADPEVIAALIMCCAKRAGNEISEEDINSMSIPEMMAASQGIAGMVADFMPEASGDVSKNVKRQK